MAANNCQPKPQPSILASGSTKSVAISDLEAQSLLLQILEKLKQIREQMQSDC